MAKQLKSFHRNIQNYLIWLMVIFMLLLTLGFSYFLNHWCQQLIRVHGDHLVTIVQSSNIPKLTKKAKLKLKHMPHLDLIAWYHPKENKYYSWKKVSVKSEQLTQSKAFLKSYRRKNHKISPDKSSFFLFKKSLEHFGRFRLIYSNLLIQFDLTSLLLSYMLSFIGLLTLLSLVLLLLARLYIEQIYRAMSNAISDIEGLLKEIFVGNFDVLFSAREFTFTQRIANIMNQMLFFYNEHTQQKDQESQRDPLTGLYTRRYFINVFENEIKRARRYNHSLSFLMIDIDHFKKFNDNYGHLMGDKVLLQTAHLILEKLRGTDIVVRYGGEEIAVILSETRLEYALLVAEKLRACIAEAKYSYQKSTIHVTISIGVTALLENQSESCTKIIKRADTGLYEAKNKGRNRVCYLK